MISFHSFCITDILKVHGMPLYAFVTIALALIIIRSILRSAVKGTVA